jgi:lauroyl/myristoyl acyltransferase
MRAHTDFIILLIMAVVGWFALGALPLGAIALAVLLFGWIIVTIQDRRRAKAGRDQL